MRFLLAVYSAPSSQGARSAWQFADAACQSGHEIDDIFFYMNGIWNVYEPSWQALAHAYQIQLKKPLVLSVCPTAALHRGLDFAREALPPPFRLAGLGQFFSALKSADRYVVFGE